MKRLKVITQIISIWFASLFITKDIKASTKPTINQRVNSIRESISQKEPEGDTVKPYPHFTSDVYAQWNNWGKRKLHFKRFNFFNKEQQRSMWQ